LSVAAVFPGQGAQRLGMARDFHDAYAEARAVFEQASSAAGFDVAKVCFEDEERLACTEFQQPAVLTAELAILAVLRAQFGFAPQWFGGHSLGEYAALAAAGVLDAAAAAALVRERGRLMQEAVAPGEGAMTAVLLPGLDVGRLRDLLAPLDVDVANVNSPGQVVLSGRAAAVSLAVEHLKADAHLARARCVALRVSAPFHSRLMEPAAKRFRTELERASRSWRLERAPQVVSNLTASFYPQDRDALVDTLTQQICRPVRWLECMRALLERADSIVEIGPGKTLAGFFKGLDVTIRTVSNLGDATELGR
jgi:[acyl-carrier-protein] S-malonyltransferase/trans-AT polyketide synthase/acyltransferase/oxidoreductase domain-containing protein